MQTIFSMHLPFSQSILMSITFCVPFPCTLVHHQPFLPTFLTFPTHSFILTIKKIICYIFTLCTIFILWFRMSRKYSLVIYKVSTFKWLLFLLQIAFHVFHQARRQKRRGAWKRQCLCVCVCVPVDMFWQKSTY